MDPCPFVRLIVESLALKLHTTNTTTTTTKYCYFVKLKLTNFPSRTTLLPITAATTTSPLPESSETSAASFDMDPETLRGLSCNNKALLTLKLSVYTGKQQSTGLGTCGKLLGSVQVCVNLSAQAVQGRACVYHSGWMKLGGHISVGGSGNTEPVAKQHVTVRSEPDPRYVFQFGGEPECSPVVYQIQGKKVRQPVFSCKFTADRNSNNRSRSLPSDFNNSNKKTWLRRTFSSDKEQRAATSSSRRERKGWMAIIYDLSGSAIASASMITPFVPSPNSDSVSRSNPGAWLILRPNSGSWKPWGRLEAWREKRKNEDALGYRFDLVDDTGLSNGIPIAEGSISVRKGGDFRIHDSANYYTGLGYLPPVRGFVMGANVEGEGRVSKPTVHVGAQYVTCMADAALSAALDLSMDACRVFSSKLRKELFGSDEVEQLFS